MNQRAVAAKLRKNALPVANRWQMQRCGGHSCASRGTRHDEQPRHRRPARGSGVGTMPALVPDGLHAPGQPVGPTRRLMRTHVGHDFGRVSVHAGKRDAASVRAVDAPAFAGRDPGAGAGLTGTGTLPHFLAKGARR